MRSAAISISTSSQVGKMCSTIVLIGTRLQVVNMKGKLIDTRCSFKVLIGTHSKVDLINIYNPITEINKEHESISDHIATSNSELH